MNGYETRHALPLEVRADILETVAGYDAADMDRELSFAVGALDLKDPASMRWLATLLARCIAEQEFAARS